MTAPDLTNLTPSSDSLADELAELVRRSRRRRRYELLHWRRRHARRLGAGAGARSCTFAHQDVTVAVTAAGQAHVSGIKRCGSIWSCPVCAPTIREQRAAEIDTACKNWLASGGRIWFVSATIPHRRRDPLPRLMDLAQSIWSWAWSGEGGKAVRSELGIVHTVRAWDHTYGANGWHPHFHALFFVEPESSGFGWFSPALVADRLRESWHMHGIGDQWVPNVSVDVRPVHDIGDVGRYTAKVEGRWGAGLELARADLKRGHGLSSAQVLELASHGAVDEAWAIEAWIDWERATKGRQCIAWGKGARAALGLVEDVDDEDLATDEVDPDDVVVAEHRIPLDVWNRHVEAGTTWRLLDRFEQGTFDFATTVRGGSSNELGPQPPP